MDPVEYVASKNLHRRQLTTTQRAMAAAKAINYHGEEAKKRQGTRTDLQLPGTGAGKFSEARDQAGKTFGVSGRSVGAATYVLKHGTEEEKSSVQKGKAKLKPLEAKVWQRVKNTPKPKPTFNATNDSIERLY